MKNVQITSDVGTLTGTLIAPENPNGKGVLFLHGWESSQEGYIARGEALATIGITSLAFNLPGHGTSEGDMQKLTRREYLDASLSAYDFLAKQEGIDAIGVVGASFGAYLGAILTKERNVRWLVLRAPASYEDEGFDDVSQMQFRYEHPDMITWREKELQHDEIVSLKALHEYPNDVLIVESGKDTIVPHQSTQNYINAVSDKSKLTHVVIKEASHELNDERQRQEFIKILVEWFKEKS